LPPPVRMSSIDCVCRPDTLILGMSPAAIYCTRGVRNGLGVCCDKLRFKSLSPLPSSRGDRSPGRRIRAGTNPCSTEIGPVSAVMAGHSASQTRVNALVSRPSRLGGHGCRFNRGPREPSGSQQCVTEDQPDTCQQRQRAKEAERGPCELTIPDLKTLDEGAEHDALRKRRSPMPFIAASDSSTRLTASSWCSDRS
jgi:hypothetical protein